MKFMNLSKNGFFALTIFCALALGACAQTGTRESTGAYVDNSAVTAKVKTAILQDPSLKVMQIHVTTYKNIVQLSGFVDTPQMVERAGKVARDVEGVTSVQNDLIVK
jgi:osmotically-inducible protein OsmY